MPGVAIAMVLVTPVDTATDEERMEMVIRARGEAQKD